MVHNGWYMTIDITFVMYFNKPKFQDKFQQNLINTIQTRSGGLHHFPIGCPFLLLIHGLVISLIGLIIN